MSHKSLYAVASITLALSLGVLLTQHTSAIAYTVATVTLTLSVVVVVRLLTAQWPTLTVEVVPMAVPLSWHPTWHATPQLAVACVESVPAGFQVQQAPPVCVLPCGGSDGCDCLVEAPVVVKRGRKPRVAATSRVAAKATKPTTVAPRKPRARKSAPTTWQCISQAYIISQGDIRFREG